MTSPPIPSWPRPHLQPGGYDAQLFYKAQGDLDPTLLRVSRSKHRFDGLPEGVQLEAHQRSNAPDVLAMGTEHPVMRTALDALGPKVRSSVLAAPDCMVLRGHVAQPQTLDYLRNAVGIIQALFEAGAHAIYDPFCLTWWSAPQWEERFFAPNAAVPTHHVVILESAENTGDTTWIHTRGMLKFGRPDLSIRGVPTGLRSLVIDLCNRFITLQALGGVVPDGQTIRVAGLPKWTCTTQGGLDDPEFNNFHLSIG